MKFQASKAPDPEKDAHFSMPSYKWLVLDFGKR